MTSNLIIFLILFVIFLVIIIILSNVFKKEKPFKQQFYKIEQLLKEIDIDCPNNLNEVLANIEKNLKTENALITEKNDKRTALRILIRENLTTFLNDMQNLWSSMNFTEKLLELWGTQTDSEQLIISSFMENQANLNITLDDIKNFLLKWYSTLIQIISISSQCSKDLIEKRKELQTLLDRIKTLRTEIQQIDKEMSETQYIINDSKALLQQLEEALQIGRKYHFNNFI